MDDAHVYAERTEFQKIRDRVKLVRNCLKYDVWRQKVLKRDIQTYPKIPKGTCVHHLVPLEKLVRKHKIKTEWDAINCKELWDSNNGIALRMCEHKVISLIERFCRKQASEGMIAALENCLKDIKSRRVRL